MVHAGAELVNPDPWNMVGILDRVEDNILFWVLLRCQQSLSFFLADLLVCAVLDSFLEDPDLVGDAVVRVAL